MNSRVEKGRQEMWNESPRGKGIDPSDLEKKVWKEVREDLLRFLQKQGFTADVTLVESQMEKIREAIWEDAPIRDVMSVALEIVIPETIGSRIDFWKDIIQLCLVLPAGRIGCNIIEALSNSPDKIAYIHTEAETDDIERDDFIYNLNSEYQLELFNYFNGRDDTVDVLDVEPSVERQLLDNTDVQALLALRDVKNKNYIRAKSRLMKIVERLDEPDESVESMLSAIDGLDEPAASPRQTVAQKPARREAPKIGRNSPCPCGSGLKYKNCCGKNA